MSAAVINCPKCGASNSAKEEICVKCGIVFKKYKSRIENLEKMLAIEPIYKDAEEKYKQENYISAETAYRRLIKSKPEYESILSDRLADIEAKYKEAKISVQQEANVSQQDMAIGDKLLHEPLYISATKQYRELNYKEARRIFLVLVEHKPEYKSQIQPFIEVVERKLAASLPDEIPQTIKKHDVFQKNDKSTPTIVLQEGALFLLRCSGLLGIRPTGWGILQLTDKNLIFIHKSNLSVTAPLNRIRSAIAGAGIGKAAIYK